MSNPVSLRLVQSSSTPTGTGSYSYRGGFQIVVENRAFEKSVLVVARIGSTWQEIPATYVESVPGNLEIWSASASNGEDDFAVRYTVLGETFWDNNAGWNYDFPKAFDEFNAIVGRDCPVVLGEASIAAGTLSAFVAIQNIAYSKVVGLVFTTDDWATTHVAYGAYDWTMSSGLEVWRIQAVVAAAMEVKFAVFYFVAGNEYWDNNFWRNYAVTPDSAYVARALAKHRATPPWASLRERTSTDKTVEAVQPVAVDGNERRFRERLPTN